MLLMLLMGSPLSVNIVWQVACHRQATVGL